ncbi:hypothetical protein MKW98_024488 [Papaver atlanticum]|uniref:Uncharacterized protein n=1 Tax=Papaver atlanticum TaxID=357466 RepID=A0AAD4RVD5_9MAGN|nr:hypothetical protein MKW98_024488 [Papaver atlanticum]
MKIGRVGDVNQSGIGLIRRIQDPNDMQHRVVLEKSEGPACPGDDYSHMISKWGLWWCLYHACRIFWELYTIFGFPGLLV